ncbi:hypothetical protein [Mycobacterium hubeiense]|uniref:hypothetical protein n=1 Tax=Mycobacterium hubeiense TaxID=1867256 RepID=UPI000C7EEB16|nr:hypothetical protein [Mycobacterium sp. QGD 101]
MFRWKRKVAAARHDSDAAPQHVDRGDADGDAWADFFDPYSITVSVDAGDNTLMVDFTKIFDRITEVFERYDMSGHPVGLVDIADNETWSAMLASGFCDDLCQHMAASAAMIVHRRYPAARDMPMDHRLDMAVETTGFTWTHPGESLTLAKQIVADHLRNRVQTSYGVAVLADCRHPGRPLCEMLQSTFEVCIAAISVASALPRRVRPLRTQCDWELSPSSRDCSCRGKVRVAATITTVSRVPPPCK